MTATKGLVLAARASGKVKAWAQGVALITIMAWPALFWAPAPWHLDYAYWATWICAVLSLGSMAEYFWVNRQVVAQIAHGRSASTNGAPSQSDGAALIKARGRPTGP
jgi:CDP-diacylglycerol--glycerol-3-phosphate 3-phosphatidyltransferase